MVRAQARPLRVVRFPALLLANNLKFVQSPAEEDFTSMATQDSRGILFTNTQPQQGFRLLEIPPELEALLTSKNAPV